MVNDAFVKDLTKRLVSDTSSRSEIAPGSMGRRYEPEGGIRRHNERIHRESALTDKRGNMPFTFSKPSKQVGRNATKVCSECGHFAAVKESTISMICSSCKKYVKVITLEEYEVLING